MPYRWRREQGTTSVSIYILLLIYALTHASSEQQNANNGSQELSSSLPSAASANPSLPSSAGDTTGAIAAAMASSARSTNIPTISWTPFFGSLNSSVYDAPEIRYLSSPGAPCQLTDPLLSNYTDYTKISPLWIAVCPFGYRCSKLAKLGLEEKLDTKNLPDFVGVCAPCIYGEYCPPGVVEKNPDQLLDCGGIATLTTSSINQLQKQSLAASVQACTAFSACPEGNFCPDPSQVFPCPPGSYCPSGSVAPETCNLPFLLSSRPFKPIQPSTELVLNRLIKYLKPIGANTCPDASGGPFMQCPAGYYCPNPADVIACPKGHFCPASTIDPRVCPFMANCDSTRMQTLRAKWWWLVAIVASIFLAPLMLQCWTIMGAYRMKRKRSKNEHLRQFMQMVNPSSILWGGPVIMDPEMHLGLADDVIRMRAYSGTQAQTVVLGPRVSVFFEDVTVQLQRGVRGGSVILQGVTGCFMHSSMHAVMGPSGCGKSTFICSLAGTLPKGKLTGKIEYTRHHGNRSYEDHHSRVRYLIGYVPQDDIVHEELTVAENIAYAARMRLPASTTAKQRKHAVQDVLSMLGLVPVQNSIVGSVASRGISGGQRKRVNIGMELVVKPSIIYMDEPTSGLDAAVALEVLTSLSRMADSGVNIVCVIHQPRYSIFQMFQTVLLLGDSGRTVYQGPVHLAVEYFQHIGFPPPRFDNPADFFLDVLAGAIHCEGDDDFLPSSLPDTWDTRGRVWLGSRSVGSELGSHPFRQPSRDVVVHVHPANDTLEASDAEMGGSAAAAQGRLKPQRSRLGRKAVHETQSTHRRSSEDIAGADSRMEQQGGAVTHGSMPSRQGSQDALLAAALDGCDSSAGQGQGKDSPRGLVRGDQRQEEARRVEQQRSALKQQVLRQQQAAQQQAPVDVKLSAEFQKQLECSHQQHMEQRTRRQLTPRSSVDDEPASCHVSTHSNRTPRQAHVTTAAGTQHSDSSTELPPPPPRIRTHSGSGMANAGRSSAHAAEVYGELAQAPARTHPARSADDTVHTDDTQAPPQHSGPVSEPSATSEASSWRRRTHHSHQPSWLEEVLSMEVSLSSSLVHLDKLEAMPDAARLARMMEEEAERMQHVRRRLSDAAAQEPQQQRQQQYWQGAADDAEDDSRSCDGCSMNSVQQYSSSQDNPLYEDDSADEEACLTSAAAPDPSPPQQQLPLQAQQHSQPLHSPRQPPPPPSSPATTALAALQPPSGIAPASGPLQHPNITLLRNAAEARMPGQASWRPADLQAIHKKFEVLDSDHDGMLTYKQFVEFWAGLKAVLPAKDFAAFLLAIMAEFGIKEHSTITKQQFMSVIKHQLNTGSQPGSPLHLRGFKPQASFGTVSEAGVVLDMGSYDAAAGHMSSARAQQLGRAPSIASANSGSRQASPRKLPASATARKGSSTAFEPCCDSTTAAGDAQDALAAAKLPAGGRQLPNFLSQTLLIWQRSSVKWLNSSYLLLTDFLLLVGVGMGLGYAQGFTEQFERLTLWTVIIIMGFGIQMLVTSLRTFGGESVIFLQRESPAGLSTLSYFFGKLLADTLDILLRPLIFYTVFYSVAFPSEQWGHMLLIFTCVTWYCYGLGYLISLMFNSRGAVVAATALGLVMGGIFNGAEPPLANIPDGDPMKIIDQLSYTRWAVEAYFIKIYTPPTQARSPFVVGALGTVGFCDMHKVVNMTALTRDDLLATWNPEKSLSPLRELQREAMAGAAVSNATMRNATQQVVTDVSTLPQVVAAQQLYRFFEHPSALENQCSSFYVRALLMLAMFGLVFRVLALAVLWAKVYVRRPRVRHALSCLSAC